MKSINSIRLLHMSLSHNPTTRAQRPRLQTSLLLITYLSSIVPSSQRTLHPHPTLLHVVAHHRYRETQSMYKMRSGIMPMTIYINAHAYTAHRPCFFSPVYRPTQRTSPLDMPPQLTLRPSYLLTSFLETHRQRRCIIDSARSVFPTHHNQRTELLSRNSCLTPSIANACYVILVHQSLTLI